jgi:phage gp36-like protein
MSYTTVQLMIDRFGEDELILLTDRDNTGGIDDSVLQTAIADASAVMDSYIGRRYAVPLQAPVPDVVSVHAADLARCQLYDSDQVEKVEKRCDRVFKWLDGVAAGRIMLPGIEPLVDGAAGAVIGTRRTAVFTDACVDKMPGAACK